MREPINAITRPATATHRIHEFSLHICIYFRKHITRYSLTSKTIPETFMVPKTKHPFGITMSMNDPIPDVHENKGSTKSVFEGGAVCAPIHGMTQAQP